MNTGIKGREGAREFLKSQGKDPEKFLPSTLENPENQQPKKNPESLKAGSEPSTENKKTTEENKNTVTEEQQKEQERIAQENAQKAEDEDNRRILSTEESQLTDSEKKKRKELLLLKETEKEAQKEANIQKRFNELTGQIKDLKTEKNADKEKLRLLEDELHKLKTSSERNLDKIRKEVLRLESERISRYAEEDVELPREERREMSKDEIEEWMVEDLVAAQTWLADRQLRRTEERRKDEDALKTRENGTSKADEILKKQKESQLRALARHPDLDAHSKRMEELKTQGKTKEEIQKIIFSEFPKVRIIAEILREDSDRYLLSPDGPELLVDEMEKRMNAKSGESQEEREKRIAEEAAESERQRQESIDSGLPANGRRDGVRSDVQVSEFEKENPSLYKKQLDIWRKYFPKSTEKELRARLDKRLKERRLIGAS